MAQYNQQQQAFIDAARQDLIANGRQGSMSTAEFNQLSYQDQQSARAIGAYTDPSGMETWALVLIVLICIGVCCSIAGAVGFFYWQRKKNSGGGGNGTTVVSGGGGGGGVISTGGGGGANVVVA